MNLGNKLAVGEVVDNTAEVLPAPVDTQPEPTPAVDAPEPVATLAD